QAWEQIAARFVNEPLEAVNEADALVLSVLRERGHPLDYERLPGRMREARRQRISGQERAGTEALRQSLLNYRAVFEEIVRDQDRLGGGDRHGASYCAGGEGDVALPTRGHGRSLRRDARHAHSHVRARSTGVEQVDVVVVHSDR